MSESSNPNTHISTLVISDLILFCSFVFSHPLYFSYFIFFSPYLFKLISFLSPLFVTTFLLVLAFLSQNRANLLPVAYVSFLEKSSTEKIDENEEFRRLDDLEMYEIVFGSVNEKSVEVLKEIPEEYSSFQESESYVEHDSSHEDSMMNKCEATKTEKKSVPATMLENSCAEMEEKRLENFLKILGKFERMSSSSTNVEEKKKSEPPSTAKINKVVERLRTESIVKNGSEAKGNKLKDVAPVSVSKVENNSPKIIKSQSQRISFTSFDSSNETLGSYGSMRKEKEWKRTLACKLFEERHNGDGSEGMDSLWETYENDSIKTKPKNGHNKNNKNKKSEVEVFEDDGHDDEAIGGQLCCLQALKLSAGKLNLGMRKPSLVKISKAIKGLGWLHGVSKHSKKVHNNGDRSY